jgi:hypothetical protein
MHAGSCTHGQSHQGVEGGQPTRPTSSGNKVGTARCDLTPTLSGVCRKFLDLNSSSIPFLSFPVHAARALAYGRPVPHRLPPCPVRPGPPPSPSRVATAHLPAACASPHFLVCRHATLRPALMDASEEGCMNRGGGRLFLH